MPYLPPDRREEVDTFGPGTAGDLNYEITKLVIRYVEDCGLSYQTCADVVSSLDNAKDEFRRRIQHPYENAKIHANGDVYPVALLLAAGRGGRP